MSKVTTRDLLKQLAEIAHALTMILDRVERRIDAQALPAEQGKPELEPMVDPIPPLQMP